ncbi:SFT2-domain-containing protein [Karstenula rhodostoma CBS 690.94]|uniref:Protein transport protein SFT2 n=1 Tax=Karstenula rhodostoma CBS 690.94 TaxID=1392251 RepID=A0A9P4PQG4_9PLEO|nr:SFT2-domain-containing protein [Karstenula rhodostoma CBS 690.94]
MASASFRDSMSSLGWSRRDPDVPVNTAPPTLMGRLQNLNPFGSGGYVRLPTSNDGPGAPLPAPTRREEEEGFFALSRWDRMLIFGGLLLASVALFATCIGLMFTPIFIARPSKFAILWSMASLLFLCAWGVLMGPLTYVQHLVSGPRLPFTAAYFGSIALTLYFSLVLQMFILTFIATVAQLVCLAFYTVSYFPMGSTGLRFAARFGGNRVAAWMHD